MQPRKGGRKTTSCDVCRTKSKKCGVGRKGCLNSTESGSGSGPESAPATPSSARLRKEIDHLTYTHDNHGMASEARVKTRMKNKRKEIKDHKHASAQKKVQNLSLHGFFGKQQPKTTQTHTDSTSARSNLLTKMQVQIAKAVTSAAQAAAEISSMADQDQKRRGGNHTSESAVKKLKVALSKGHTMEQCNEMIGTHRPVAVARLK